MQIKCSLYSGDQKWFSHLLSFSKASKHLPKMLRQRVGTCERLQPLMRWHPARCHQCVTVNGYTMNCELLWILSIEAINKMTFFCSVKGKFSLLSFEKNSFGGATQVTFFGPALAITGNCPRCWKAKAGPSCTQKQKFKSFVFAVKMNSSKEKKTAATSVKSWSPTCKQYVHSICILVLVTFVLYSGWGRLDSRQLFTLIQK